VGDFPDARRLELPAVAAWEHVGARAGHEVGFFAVGDDAITVDGTTTATEDGVPWRVSFHLELDLDWTTRRAEIWGRSPLGEHRRVLESDGLGRWSVDGVHDPALDGCIDLDLESSACTNTVPVRRLDLQRGEREDAPAVYVRAADLTVERLDQRYLLSPDQSSGLGGHGTWRLGYLAPRFDADFDLTVDRYGLVLDYPHLAERRA
jgi:hypothetical protein